MERMIKLNEIFKCQYSVQKWSKIVNFLGIIPDKKLAKRINVSQLKCGERNRETLS